MFAKQRRYRCSGAVHASEWGAFPLLISILLVRLKKLNDGSYKPKKREVLTNNTAAPKALMNIPAVKRIVSAGLGRTFSIISLFVGLLKQFMVISIDLRARTHFRQDADNFKMNNN